MNGLLISRGYNRNKNIGDYIQSLAQEQFFDRIDCFIDREETDSVHSEEKINLIMNGWFLINARRFPPSNSINPLYISFHLSPSVADKVLTSESIAHLKKYEPIGTRDLSTKEILEKHGIKSYFSGCLTLTLGYKFSSSNYKKEIIFVDPYCEIGNGFAKPTKFLFNIAYFWSKKNKIPNFINRNHTIIGRIFIKIYRCIFKNKEIEDTNIIMKLEKYVYYVSFYTEYSKLFSDELLFDAKFISHAVSKKSYPSERDMLEFARTLVCRYANAKLVVTSRIHCALPCLGLNTPMIFVNSEKLEKNSINGIGRFRGLTDFFNQLYFSKKGLVPLDKEMADVLKEGKIRFATSISNKDNYKPYAQDLFKRANLFGKYGRR